MKSGWAGVAVDRMGAAEHDAAVERVRIEPDDLVVAAGLCRDVLVARLDDDWERPAANVDWTCRQALEHVSLMGIAYGLRLAARATRPPDYAPLVLTEATTAQLIETMHDSSAVLGEVARAASPSARAHHTAGIADPEGWLAMAIDEALLHTADIAQGFGDVFQPPDHLTSAVLDRLFPWWPREQPPWPALQWANGRRALPGHPNPGAAWLWQCAPLDEWDGTIPVWDVVDGRPAST